MRVLRVGATGTIGSAVAQALEARGHEVVRGGVADGDHLVDLSSKESIRALYAAAGAVDAVVCTAGVARFGPLDAVDDEGWALSLRNKLMGQVELVRSGLGHVAEGGSFTLTSGTLSQHPEPGTVAVVTVGAAVEAFARAAALDLDGRYRINVVSPGPVAESIEARGQDPGDAIRAADLARAYVAFVEGTDSGRVREVVGG